MTDDILADIPKEGADPFKDMEKETPSDSPTEKEPKDGKEKDEPEEGKETPAPDEEKDIPFHKHPRWIERENRLKELESKYELTAKELAELKTKPTDKPGVNGEIPSWFKDSYGEDTEAWTKYQNWEKQWEERFEQKLLAKQEERVKAQAEDEKRWQKWVDDEIGKLVADPETKFDIKERNELIKIMLEWRPTDEQGNFDFKKGYGIYRMQKGKDDTQHSDARKKLGDAATTTSKGEPKKKDYLTAKELRGKSWTEII